MLVLYRRLQQDCAHRRKGRSHTRCQCIIWTYGPSKYGRINRSTGTRDWATAQHLVRDWEVQPASVQPTVPAEVTTQTEPITIRQAVDRFIAKLEGRSLRPSTIRKHRLLLAKQLIEFSNMNRLEEPRQLKADPLENFRSGWADGPLSSCKKIQRLRAFFSFCQKNKWISENPALDLEAPKLHRKPTLPFTQDEMVKIIAAIDAYIESSARNGFENAQRIRALILLLRYSGMRISDAVSLSTDRIRGNRLFLYTQKTDVPVHTVLPQFVASALGCSPLASERHFFWSGKGDLESAVRSWQTRLRRLFRLAGIPGHAHRFRDTFAVELLLAGVPIERVSVLLGHQSIRVTERHYNPWVHARQQQLEADLAGVWARDPMCFKADQVTRELRGNSKAVN
jgi:integrase/recombinase XerD